MGTAEKTPKAGRKPATKGKDALFATGSNTGSMRHRGTPSTRGIKDLTSTGQVQLHYERFSGTRKVQCCLFKMSHICVLYIKLSRF